MLTNNADKIYNSVGVEAVLTERSDLRQYLTGVATSFGYVISDNLGTVFYTDARYLERAQSALNGSGINVKLFKGSLEEILKNYKEIAVPLSSVTFREYKKLTDMGLKVADSDSAFISAMSVKQNYEKENIKKACEIAIKAFNKVLPIIKEGMTENEVAAELEYLMRKLGAEGTSFETIVAFGANSSIPHHETGQTKLKFGDIVLIDFGCKFGGYCSDCTRTFLYGEDRKHEEFKKVYVEVLNAHMIAKENFRDGITGKQADAFARDYLQGKKLAEYFTHSLGHGIGINIHEFPRLSPKSDDILKNGMVFSDEPGVYFEGKFGIRIEDTILLENGIAQSLTDSDKNLIIL